MKKILIILLGLCSMLFAGTDEEVISNAERAEASGDLDKAVEILENGIQSNTDSADLYSKYGSYLSRQAGEAGFMKAGILSNKAFKQFNKALELEPGHVEATLYRGILAVNMPKFLSKLEQGISDLQFIIKNYGSDPELCMVSTYYLGKAFQKNEENEKAAGYFKHIVLYGKETSFYEDAKQQYESLVENQAVDHQKDHYSLGMDFLEKGDLNNAVIHLREAAKLERENLELHLVLVRTLGELAGQGYDETIREDVTARAEIANEVFEVLNHCVELAPDNDEILFLRGSVSVNLPFFVNSLETGIADLSYLNENGKTPEMKAKAGFVLKQAQEKKLIFELAEAGYLAKTEEEKEALLMRFISSESPVKQEIPEGEYLQVCLNLGYRDQIEPQSAVWIEDMDGNYIETLYVSAFAASVKEKQVHLPIWAGKSDFKKIASVTGASIDCGKHVFYWDFTDFEGSRFTNREFLVKSEICHWPHVQYTCQSLPVDLNRKEKFSVSGDNYLIYMLSAEYKRR